MTLMKKILLLLLISKSIFCQSIAKIDTGNIDGADFKILFPKEWKGKLIMYAHGYEFMGTQPRQSKNNDWPQRMKPFLDRGYAVAASDYKNQGLALAQGVDDTEALRKYFIKKYGKVDTTYMVGHSMGGGITLATIENYGKHYKGGLPLCPLSGRIYLQTRREFDLIASFNVLFPGMMPSLKEILDHKQNFQTDMGRSFGKAMQLKQAIFKKDSTLAKELAQHFDLKVEDLAFTLAFGENVLRDVVKKAGGNPYDNINTLYGRFPNNLMLNQKIERIQATVGQDVFVKYDRTGQIDKPVLVLHTMYDQLIPAEMAITPYENLIQRNGNNTLYTVKYTNGQGHCNFTNEQTGQAFDELRTWVKTGKKAMAGFMGTNE
jgi:pimeloyl-ACP methyl ester carboxylesterase